MESYWHIDDSHESTTETFNFLHAQVDLLSCETNGEVMAKFIKKRTLAYVGMQAALEKASERLITAHKGQDATSLYGKNEYEFFVTDKNNKYELAIFEMSCNDEYPIMLKIDSDIAYEANLKSEYEVLSFEDFQGLFADMLKTPKVNYVIRKLRTISKTTADS